MPFWKKSFNSRAEVYFPQSIVQGKPVETETIAKDLAKISTVSNPSRRMFFIRRSPSIRIFKSAFIQPRG